MIDITPNAPQEFSENEVLYEEEDPDFRSFELSRNMRYFIYFVKILGCSKVCGKKTSDIINKINHADRCLDRDFNIKELVLHMKKNMEMSKRNKENIRNNTRLV